MSLEHYSRFGPLVGELIKDSKELFLVFEALSSFLTKYKRDATVPDLHAYFLSLHPALPKDQKEFYDVVLSNIDSARVSEEVIDGLLQSLHRKKTLLNMAVLAYEVGEGRKEMEELVKVYKTLDSVQPELTSGNTSFVTDDLSEIYDRTVKAVGLRWRLSSLNSSLGSLRKGDFGFVFARPETGKTTFLASECTHMASQAENPVVWFNNEEQGEKVMLRCYQAALARPLDSLFSDMAATTKQFRTYTKGNLRLYDAATISKREVETFCSQIKPSLIIFDQIDKIVGFADDRDDLKLGAIYQWARELAKTYCPVIGICQADGTAEGIKWLTMSHVSNAKTSKQAEADWILGIGRSNDAGYEMVRHFNISKNKLLGDTDSNPARRHDRWDCLIKPELASYEDIL